MGKFLERSGAAMACFVASVTLAEKAASGVESPIFGSWSSWAAGFAACMFFINIFSIAFRGVR